MLRALGPGEPTARPQFLFWNAFSGLAQALSLPPAHFPAARRPCTTGAVLPMIEQQCHNLRARLTCPARVERVLLVLLDVVGWWAKPEAGAGARSGEEWRACVGRLHTWSLMERAHEGKGTSEVTPKPGWPLAHCCHQSSAGVPWLAVLVIRYFD